MELIVRRFQWRPARAPAGRAIRRSDAAKPTLVTDTSGSTNDLYRSLSGFRAECPESGGQSGASRPGPAGRSN